MLNICICTFIYLFSDVDFAVVNFPPKSKCTNLGKI